MRKVEIDIIINVIFNLFGINHSNQVESIFCEFAGVIPYNRPTEKKIEPDKQVKQMAI